jgi:DNA-binding MarR family transcriptional regulator
MATKNDLDIDNFVCFALYSASRAMTQLYRTYLDEHDLTYPQFLTLFLLWQQDGRSVSEISDELLLESATVTPLLKRMESKGLLTRARSADDERVVQVFLTKRGRAHRALLQEVAGGMVCDLDMSPAEIRAMAKQLHALRATIEESANRRRPQ